MSADQVAESPSIKKLHVNMYPALTTVPNCVDPLSGSDLQKCPVAQDSIENNRDYDIEFHSASSLFLETIDLLCYRDFKRQVCLSGSYRGRIHRIGYGSHVSENSVLPCDLPNFQKTFSYTIPKATETVPILPLFSGQSPQWCCKRLISWTLLHLFDISRAIG